MPRMRYTLIFLFVVGFSLSEAETVSDKNAIPRDIFSLIECISIGAKRSDVEKLLGRDWKPGPIAGWNRGQSIHYRNAVYSSFIIHIWYGHVGEQGIGRKSSMNDPVIEKATIEKQK